MNNYYTLIYLNREIKEKIRNVYFDFAISPHKDVLHIYLQKNESRCRLIFSANPEETVLFLDDFRPPKKDNVTTIFNGLKQHQITKMELADEDRLLSIYFDDGRKLLFKLYGASPNVLLIEDGEIKSAFKNPGQLMGSRPPEPKKPVSSDEVSPQRSPKNQLTEINPLLPRNLLPYIVEQHKVAEMSPGKTKDFAHELTKALTEEDHPRVLATGDFCLWSKRWLDMPVEKECEAVNDCVAYAYKNAVHLRRLSRKKKDVKEFLERAQSGSKSLINQLKEADKSLDRADKYEKYGHLLMAHAHEKLEAGKKSITVADFYQKNDDICIPLKIEKDISANAEYYYEKSGDARKAYKKAKQRLPEERSKYEQITELIGEVEEIDDLYELDRWLKNHKSILQDFGYGSEGERQQSSPYRKFNERNYEIWIGKSAKSNDKLTSLAHKEDIWLHARGVAGSHVVIRMGNNKGFPPKQVILKAAAYAAHYSKARGMKTAPVMYTKRKYVRKPKGASAGAVIVEREEVELVPPLNPNKS